MVQLPRAQDPAAPSSTAEARTGPADEEVYWVGAVHPCLGGMLVIRQIAVAVAVPLGTGPWDVRVFGVDRTDARCEAGSASAVEHKGRGRCRAHSAANCLGDERLRRRATLHAARRSLRPADADAPGRACPAATTPALADAAWFWQRERLDGQVVRLLPGYRLPEQTIHALTTSRAAASGKVRRFVDYVEECLRLADAGESTD